MGRRLGIVIYHIICIRDAPSTLAAWYISSSIPDIAAMYMMADQPRFFQVSHSHIVSHTCSEDCRKRIGSVVIPRFCSRVFAIPVLLKRL